MKLVMMTPNQPSGGAGGRRSQENCLELQIDSGIGLSIHQVAEFISPCDWAREPSSCNPTDHGP